MKLAHQLGFLFMLQKNHFLLFKKLLSWVNQGLFLVLDIYIHNNIT